MATGRRSCPDDGACHHDCAPEDCFRVRACEPLSGVFIGNRWPLPIVRQYGNQPEKATIEDVIVAR